MMVENNDLTYDAWKEYLKNDKEMNAKWKSLVVLWENVKKDLKENLESLPYSEALRRRKYLTAKNIFNAISTAKEKPDFSWFQKIIYNEEDERHEYVIQCTDPSSDYIFRKIKEERGVANMHGESIDKYLKPVADKIRALKDTLRVSIQTESNPQDLSYESMKMGKSQKLLDDEKEVDPDYPKAPEWWRDPVDPRVSWPCFEPDTDNWNNVNWSDEVRDNWQKIDKDGQYLIDFPDFND